MSHTNYMNPDLPDYCGSWVVTRRDTAEAVFETFSRTVADTINREKYDVHPVYDYLTSLNRSIKAE